jgi:hypothetical protein
VRPNGRQTGVCVPIEGRQVCASQWKADRCVRPNGRQTGVCVPMEGRQVCASQWKADRCVRPNRRQTGVCVPMDVRQVCASVCTHQWKSEWCVRHNGIASVDVFPDIRSIKRVPCFIHPSVSPYDVHQCSFEFFLFGFTFSFLFVTCGASLFQHSSVSLGTPEAISGEKKGPLPSLICHTWGLGKLTYNCVNYTLRN